MPGRAHRSIVGIANYRYENGDLLMSNASRPRRRAPRLRRLAALATGNRPARVYLAVFAASLLVMVLAPDHALAMGPMLLTMPLSFWPVLLPFGPGSVGEGPGGVPAAALWALWLTLCACVNAAVLGALAERGAAAARTPRAEPAPVAEGRTRRLRALLTPAVDNWPARVYLALVAAAVGFFLYAAYLAADPGFAAIWPVLATAPLGFAAFLLAVPAEGVAWLSPLLFSAGALASGLLNASLLGRLVHRLHPLVRPSAGNA